MLLEFTYDAEGNLTQKTEPNGDIWKYEYSGNGMLSKVVRPDGTEVSFKYDSLGRRLEKSTPDKTTRFLWDGNTPLHEWEDADVVTWVFNEGFVPAAKLTNNGNCSIISDYMGTPVEAYDATGVKVWSAELDIYGRVKDCAGDVEFIPFRYQGQYADVETGLYYNRFRYYDPVIGQYTQQDPIGLAGNNPTLYGYVRNSNAWVDPFGLDTFSSSNGLTLDVYGYTSISHLSDADLSSLFHANNNALLKGSPVGLSPKDVQGNTIVLHHLGQNPEGPIQAMPAQQHSIGDRGQHPYGNTKGAGLTPEERADFNEWKQEYWKDKASEEQEKRKAPCKD